MCLRGTTPLDIHMSPVTTEVGRGVAVGIIPWACFARTSPETATAYNSIFRRIHLNGAK